LSRTESAGTISGGVGDQRHHRATGGTVQVGGFNTIVNGTNGNGINAVTTNASAVTVNASQVTGSAIGINANSAGVPVPS